MAWTHISMNFVEGLHKSQKKNVILVGSLYPSLSHPYTAAEVAQLFLDNIFKLHGLPKVILTDGTLSLQALYGNPCSKLWVQRYLTSAYHPQTDG
jgi:hypothetical protein